MLSGPFRAASTCCSCNSYREMIQLRCTVITDPVFPKPADSWLSTFAEGQPTRYVNESANPHSGRKGPNNAWQMRLQAMDRLSSSLQVIKQHDRREQRCRATGQAATEVSKVARSPLHRSHEHVQWLLRPMSSLFGAIERLAVKPQEWGIPCSLSPSACDV